MHLALALMYRRIASLLVYTVQVHAARATLVTDCMALTHDACCAYAALVNCNDVSPNRIFVLLHAGARH